MNGVVRVFWFIGFVFALVTPLFGQTALRQSLLDESFQAAQWAFLSSAASAMRQTSVRRSVGQGELAQMLRQHQSLGNLLSRVERDLVSLDRSGDQAAKTATRLAGEIAGLNDEISAIGDLIARDFPAFQQQTRPRPLTVLEVQAKLLPDEGLVFLYSGENATYVWAITPKKAAWHRVSLGAKIIEAAVMSIRQSMRLDASLRAATALDDSFAGTQVTPFNRVTAMLLYNELLRPLESVLTDVAHLYSVTDGPLGGLPLSLLITDEVLIGEDGDPAALRATSWFFQRHALTTLPSVESLGLIGGRDKARDKSGKPVFLGFGDPALSGDIYAPADAVALKSGRPSLESIRALAPLPYTRIELEALAAAMGADAGQLYLGAQATETALRAAPLETADVIAFATHGLLSGDLSGLAEPALVFTPPVQASRADDGLLVASEIAELTLNADWIILSACNTAGSDGRPDGEGLSGLARAFLFAGARSIMVSHWPVRDDAAARLTTSTFDVLARTDKPRRKARALQIAMQDLLMDLRDPTLANPAIWAPFVIVGEGGF